tara:strand:- start:89 stop:424 length:336 start_codon:yes stop_codon:yes gene_type:complete
MGRKGIQVDEEVFNAVKLMYPDMSWTSILRLLLEPKGLPKDYTQKPKGLDNANDVNVFTNSVNKSIVDSRTIEQHNEAYMGLYASKDDLKALKDKFSMVLTQLIKKNNLQK